MPPGWRHAGAQDEAKQSGPGHRRHSVSCSANLGHPQGAFADLVSNSAGASCLVLPNMAPIWLFAQNISRIC